MTFQPFVIGTGLNAWMTLKSTMDRQQEVFAERPDVVSDLSRYQDTIDAAGSVTDLMDNRTALRVALGAFDLSEDINNTFFIRKVLEDGTDDPSALANRLQDDRYKQLAEAFSPAKFVLGLTKFDSFNDDIADKYRGIAFEKAVGEINPDLRLALGFRRAIPDVADATTNDAAWYQVLANPPVKEVFQQVFGLPTQFGLLDIDRQHEILKEKSETHLGTADLAELTSDDAIETTIRTFLLKRQVADSAAVSPMQTALSLVSAIPRTSLLGGTI